MLTMHCQHHTNMANQEHLDLLIKQLDLIEKDLVVYHTYVDKFYHIWSRLPTSGQSFSLLSKHRSYGKFLLDYTFKETEEFTETKIGSTTLRIPRKSLEGCIDLQSKILGISFLLFRLNEEYPTQQEKIFMIPRHKNLSDEQKEEMQRCKDYILASLDKVRKRLDLLQPVITYVKDNTH